MDTLGDVRILAYLEGALVPHLLFAVYFQQENYFHKKLIGNKTNKKASVTKTNTLHLDICPSVCLTLKGRTNRAKDAVKFFILFAKTIGLL